MATLPTTTIAVVVSWMLSVVRTTDSLVLTQCISSAWVSLPRLSCTGNGNSMLYIELAYVARRLAVTSDTVDLMCMSNSSLMEPIDVDDFRPSDCVLNVDGVTDDVIFACSTFGSCRVPSAEATNYYPSEAGTSCSSSNNSNSSVASATGYRYININYDCLPSTQSDGSSITFIYVTSPVTYVDVHGAFYAVSSGYPINWNRGRNRCLVLLPANVSASLDVLDARARAINSSPDCAYRLLVTGALAGNASTIVYGDWCTKSNWTRRTILVPDTGPVGLSVGVAFEPATDATVEGKLWMMMTVTSVSSGLPADNVDVQCGPEVTGLPTVSQHQPTTMTSPSNGVSQQTFPATSSPLSSRFVSSVSVTEITVVSTSGEAPVVGDSSAAESAWSWQITVIIIVVSIGVGILLFIGVITAAVARRRYNRRISRGTLNNRGNSDVIQAWSDSLQISKVNNVTAAAAAAPAVESAALGSTGASATDVKRRQSTTGDIRNSDRRNDVIGDADGLPASLHAATAPESSLESGAMLTGSNATPTFGYEFPGTYANITSDNRSVTNFV